jgi:signal transduction histidine kinase
VERFVHKLGNHFTLLHVVLGSLRRVLPQSREAEVLHETVDRAIDLTRSFSEYNQKPSCWTESLDIIQVLQGAIIRVQPSFQEKGVNLEEKIDVSVEKIAVSGDPFLLELALGRVLQNALEATGEGGTVRLEAKAEMGRASHPAVYIGVKDTGPGIEEENLHQVLAPFFTTKEGHEGLGLTMAGRFVEMHSGALQVMTKPGKGTEIAITLPAFPIERVTRENRQPASRS